MTQIVPGKGRKGKGTRFYHTVLICTLTIIESGCSGVQSRTSIDEVSPDPKRCEITLSEPVRPKERPYCDGLWCFVHSSSLIGNTKHKCYRSRGEYEIMMSAPSTAEVTFPCFEQRPAIER